MSQRVNGVDSYFHTDWLGSTRDLTDDTGSTLTNALRYDAFGNRVATGGSYDPTPFQFAGDWGYQSAFATGVEDGPGLQYLTNRYYDPAIGRFVSADPLGFLPGANLYRYVGNGPVSWVDPLGLDAENAEPGWAQGLENGLGTTRAIVGGLGGGSLGGGGGFLAGVVGGPTALLTGGAGAAEGWALGTAGGYAAGRGLGRGIAGGIQFFAARGRGGAGRGGRGDGRPPAPAAACPTGEESPFGGLTSKEINQKFLKGEQFRLIGKFFGRTVEGAASRAANFEIPAGLTRQSLEAYAEIARRAIAAGEDKLGVQQQRLDLIQRALEQLK